MPGAKHAEQVAKSLTGIAASVKVLTLRGVPEKGDVSDWLNAGHSADELRKLAEAAPGWEPAKSGVANSPDPISVAAEFCLPERR